MRSLTIQIPQPCHERWDEMHPADRGRFCASCQKTVVDYTNYSDQELVRLLSKAPETACGRFRDEQLNRPLTRPKPGSPVWRHWVGLLTMGLFGWQTARGQSSQVAKPAQAVSMRPVFSVSVIPVQKAISFDAKVTINGRVMLEDTNRHLSPMSGWNVSVFQSGETWQARTDSCGFYRLTVPVRVQQNPIQDPVKFSINASYPGYLRAGSTVSVKPTATSVSVDDIILRQLLTTPRTITGGGICIIQPPSRWQKLKRKLFR
ncbi:hypothetical protein [Spirosoma spitsbergense]|uniref:hypothetical protein n=1 Tax=Spirosoma spitsbergense TaxID=431554 RepID=UPI000363989F|nr:hypothetical protein [Spirosoma spitsbergense]